MVSSLIYTTYTRVQAMMGCGYYPGDHFGGVGEVFVVVTNFKWGAEEQTLVLGSFTLPDPTYRPR